MKGETNVEQYLKDQIESIIKNIKDCENENLQIAKHYNEGLLYAYNDALQKLKSRKMKRA